MAYATKEKCMFPLLQPETERIAPIEHRATHDRAPEELALGSPLWLKEDLSSLIGEEQVHSRLIDLVKYATDASPYRMFPKVVVSPRTVDEVTKVFEYAQQKGLPVTIRSAGSSLSGQSQGDGILLDSRKHWAGATVIDGGKRLKVRPGTVMFRANLALHPYGYRLGPDPASSGVATVGGVIANNASGMCCGTVENSYKTLESVSFLLPSGTFINTAEPDAEERFSVAEPELAAGLLEIKAEIDKDPALVERLKKKYSIKNTTGYHMGAFLDESTPLGIFRKLLVGSEGTLAFISEGVFETVPDDKFRLTAFLVFPDMHSACAAVAPFIASGAAAAELSDRGCLRAVEGKPGVPDRWKNLPGEATALLVEYRDPTPEKLEETAKSAQAVLAGLTLLEPAEFTKDAHIAAQYWAIRSGLLPSIGGVRPSGSSLILEDVCFPPDKLADGALDLQKIFPKHGYDGVVFGHASAGNLHFLITPFLNTQDDVERFDGFLQDVVKLVVDKYDGSLKAEHGTGRNIAPFVEHEWGVKLTEMMWRVKKLADPKLILAPDVMLTRDSRAHLRNLHTVPTVESEVDRCIECGYCESVCPSRHITTTPRQRIVLRREMLRQPTGSVITEALLKQYEYDAIETCAGDGSCALACPVGINTGMLMKRFRHEEHNTTEEYVAEKIAQNWGSAEIGARVALRLNHIATSVYGGSLVAESALRVTRSVVSKDLVPGWLPVIPPAATPEVPPTTRENAAAVYFHACVNRIFAATEGDKAPSIADAMVAVSARAGMPLWIPDDLSGTCCATVWHSKGYADGNKYMANLIVEKMWEWSDGGKISVVCDATSCTFGITTEIVSYLSLQNAERHKQLTLLDSVAWAHDYLLPKLQVQHQVESAVIHPVCALHHLGLVEKLQHVSAALAKKAVTPIYATCCAFAGDRGFLHPELTGSATSEEVEEIGDQQFDEHICSNRTCELGMNLATGKDYRSIIFLLEELTRPSNHGASTVD
jgi:D-lactate dehydrogenase